MRILNNMVLSARTFTLILIMLALPLQGALAAIMPLCAQVEPAKNRSSGLETQIHPGMLMSSSPSTACAEHDMVSHEQTVNNKGASDEMALNLPCDGVVCHINGSGLPPATSALNPASGFSFAEPFSFRFTSFILQQLQRPPLV